MVYKIWLLMLLGFALLGSDSSSMRAFAQEETAKRKVMVCSTTQVADFARNVVGDRWEVICVLAPGEDPHSYQPGNDDLLSVGRADLCIENGWHLEGGEWMRTLARNANKPLVTCIKGVSEIMVDEGGQPVKDPHAWFNPANAWIYTKNIRDAVATIDPEHASEYAARANLYQYQLMALNRWIENQVSLIKGKKVLVTHHDAFGYFGQKYGFQAISPVGWSTAELASVSLNQRQQIVKQIRELGVPSIFVETSLNRELIAGIARDAGVEIGGELYSDAMGPQGSAGETYLGMMRENVLTIVESLK